MEIITKEFDNLEDVALLIQQTIDFKKYVKSFYGKEGLYPLEVSDKDIDNAIDKYISILKTTDRITWGYGDSIDRERVRTIIILSKEYIPISIDNLIGC